jgi:hypothetical protein
MKRITGLVLCLAGLWTQGVRGDDDLRYDMGPADSPVAVGFQKIGLEDMYDAERGFGWETAPESDFSRDKHWPGELPYWHDQLRELPLDPLARDGVASGGTMVFRVDVPKGQYVVRGWIGDYVEYALHQNLEVNGQQVFKDLDAGLGGIWGQILWTAVTPFRGVVNADEGTLRFAFSTEGEPGKFQARLTGLQIRRYVPGPVRLNGTELEWTGPSLPRADFVCKMLNSGEISHASKHIQAIPTAGAGRYYHACLWEALAGRMELIDPAKSLAAVEAALRLLEKPIPEVDPVALIERKQILEEYRDAHKKVRMMGYRRADELTKTNQFRRLQEARALAAQILPDEPLYWQGRLLQARVHFWIGREGNKREADLAKPVIEDLLRVFPDNRMVRMYANQIGHDLRVAPIREFVVETPGAPEWAVVQRALLSTVKSVIQFWTTERQLENGEIGGGWNDDVEILRKWGAVASAVDLPVVNQGIARLADGVWEANSDLQQHGYPRGKNDVEHGAEDVSDTQPVSIALNYGEPRFVARCLLNSSHIERLWTGRTENGRRHFKSYNYGWDVVDDDPEARFDVVLNARAANPGLYAAWYTQNAQLLGVLEEWSESWVAAAMSTEGNKPRGVFPAGVKFPEGRSFDPWYSTPTYKNYTKPGYYDHLLFEHLLGMWLITGKERYLEPMHGAMELAVAQWQSGASGPEGSAAWAGQAMRRRIVETACRWRLITGDERYDEFLRAESVPLVQYQLGGADRGDVVNALRAAIDYNATNYEMLTSEVLFTDRVFLKGANEIATIYGGGVGISRCPSQAVRWENGGEDLAAWVEEAGHTHFRASVFNFAAQERQVGMQHWRLQPGVYSLSLRSEESPGTGEPPQTVTLRHRGDSIPLSLPSRVSYEVELKQVNRFAWDPSTLPDLAAPRKPKSVSARQVEWKIFNLGSQAAHAVQVELRAGETVLAQQRIAELPGVRDYRLGEAMVSFACEVPDVPLTLLLDPQDDIAEITERNNRVSMQADR